MATIPRDKVHLRFRRRVGLARHGGQTVKIGALSFTQNERERFIVRGKIARGAARAVTMQDILLVSSFGFWAVLLGLLPMLALYTLLGE
jgi:hypothetical protein